MSKIFNLPAFLLIELLISLVLLTSLISIVGCWQLQVAQQALELQQYTQALSLAENVIEQALAHKNPALLLAKSWQLSVPSPTNTVYNLELQVKEIAKTKFKLVLITVRWQARFSKQQRVLKLDTGL